MSICTYKLIRVENQMFWSVAWKKCSFSELNFCFRERVMTIQTPSILRANRIKTSKRRHSVPLKPTLSRCARDVHVIYVGRGKWQNWLSHLCAGRFARSANGRQLATDFKLITQSLPLKSVFWNGRRFVRRPSAISRNGRVWSTASRARMKK